MYKAIFLNSRESNYYLNNELIFNLKRKDLIFGLRSICEIKNKEKVLVKFNSAEFGIYSKLEILYQDLSHKITLKKETGKYYIIVDGKSIKLKFYKNPFSEKICKVFLNELCVGEVNKAIINNKTNYNFDFIDTFNLEYFALIFFAIYNVGIEDSI